MVNILIVFDSHHGKTEQLASQIARGAQSEGVNAWLRRVPKVSLETQQVTDELANEGIPYVTKEELRNCDGLAIGSPCRFGNMSASLKYFIDSTADIWLSGELSGKPASVFTSSGSLHGGQESTLLSMMIPLMHHGMLISGVPYAGTELSHTESGGAPYGATHWAGHNNERPLTEHEKQFAKILGERLAKFAKQLTSVNT